MLKAALLGLLVGLTLAGGARAQTYCTPGGANPNCGIPTVTDLFTVRQQSGAGAKSVAIGDVLALGSSSPVSGNPPRYGVTRFPLSAAPTTTVTNQTLTFSTSSTVSTVNGSTAILFDPDTIYTAGALPGYVGYALGMAASGAGVPGGATIAPNNPPAIAIPTIYFFRAVGLSAAPTSTVNEIVTVSRASTGTTTSGSALVAGFSTVSAVTSGASAAGTHTLSFASCPANIDWGMHIRDRTAPTAINGFGIVHSFGGSPCVVDIRDPIASPGVGSGDTIDFIRLPVSGGAIAGTGVDVGATVLAFDPVADTLTMSTPATASGTVAITDTDRIQYPLVNGVALINPSNAGLNLAYIGDTFSSSHLAATVNASYTSFPISAPATATASGITFTGAQVISGMTQTAGVASVTVPASQGPFYMANTETVTGSGIPGGTTFSGPFTVDFGGQSAGLRVGTGASITPGATGGLTINTGCPPSPSWGSCVSPATFLPNGTLYFSLGKNDTLRLPNNADIVADQWSGPRTVNPWLFAEVNQWVPYSVVTQPSMLNYRSDCIAPPDVTGSPVGCAVQPGDEIGFEQFTGDDGVLADSPNGSIVANVAVYVDSLCGAVSARNIPGKWAVQLHNTALGPALSEPLGVRCNGDVNVEYGRLTMGNYLHPGWWIDAGGNAVLQSVQVANIPTVATLPACNAASVGKRMAVSDAASPTFLGALTGGGAVIAPAFCNGSAWVAS